MTFCDSVKVLQGRNTNKRVVQHPTSADNVALLAFAAASRAAVRRAAVAALLRRSAALSIGGPGAQQQTRRSCIQRSIDGTDRRTDGRTDTVS